MNEAILCVDDEPTMLAANRHFLTPHFKVETACGGAEGLVALAERGPFAVVVSDLQMPGMNGIQFLAAARARHPDTVRLLLTGNPGLDSAIQAVNDGHVFRFLTKPCAPATLVSAVRAAVDQHRLITAQRDLLENTLRASLRVLGEVLAMVSPAAFGRSLRVRQLVRDLAAAAGLADDWALDVAAALSLLGCVAVPESVLAQADRGEDLSDAEAAALARHPAVGAELLRSIPRLERVAAIVAHQNDHHATLSRGSVSPDEASGAGLLKAALDFDAILQRDGRKLTALEVMRGREGWYDPAALAALAALVRKEIPLFAREMPVEQLGVGMVVARDVYGTSGVLLLKGGAPVTEAIKLRLQAIASHGGLAGTIAVLSPAEL